MTRVTNLLQSQLMLAQLQRTQAQSFQTERQIATGKVAEYFKDLAQDTGTLMSAKALQERTSQYQGTIQFLVGRLDIQNVHLEEIANSANDLRQTVLEAVSTNKGMGLMDQVEIIFDSVVGVLNTKVDGKYIYGGTRTDVPPVNIDDISQLIAAASVDDVFDNNDLKQSNRIDDNVVIEHSFLANDIARDLFSAIKTIAEYDANIVTGPFDADLTAPQAAFLQGEVAGLATIFEDMTQVVAQNGRIHARVMSMVERHDAMELYVGGFISDIEEVDLNEAVIRLNRDQLATEATIRMISSLSDLTLLDFI